MSIGFDPVPHLPPLPHQAGTGRARGTLGKGKTPQFEPAPHSVSLPRQQGTACRETLGKGFCPGLNQYPISATPLPGRGTACDGSLGIVLRPLPPAGVSWTLAERSCARGSVGVSKPSSKSASPFPPPAPSSTWGVAHISAGTRVAANKRQVSTPLQPARGPHHGWDGGNGRGSVSASGMRDGPQRGRMRPKMGGWSDSEAWRGSRARRQNNQQPNCGRGSS